MRRIVWITVMLTVGLLPFLPTASAGGCVSAPLDPQGCIKRIRDAIFGGDSCPGLSYAVGNPGDYVVECLSILEAVGDIVG